MWRGCFRQHQCPHEKSELNPFVATIVLIAGVLGLRRRFALVARPPLRDSNVHDDAIQVHEGVGGTSLPCKITFCCFSLLRVWASINGCYEQKLE
jgi:hypothetical protein